MKIVVNKVIPFKGFKAMNLFGVLFVREECKNRVDEITINHETIHSLQMKELLYVPFYLIYLLEYFVKIFWYWNLSKAYRNISFEKEAYRFEKDMGYTSERVPFAQWKLKKLK